MDKKEKMELKKLKEIKENDNKFLQWNKIKDNLEYIYSIYEKDFQDFVDVELNDENYCDVRNEFYKIIDNKLEEQEELLRVAEVRMTMNELWYVKAIRNDDLKTGLPDWDGAVEPKTGGAIKRYFFMDGSEILKGNITGKGEVWTREMFKQRQTPYQPSFRHQ